MPHILRQDRAVKGCKGEHVWILKMKLPTELIFAFFGRQNASVRSAWSAKHAQTRIGLRWREKREKITHVLRTTITLPVLTVFLVVSFPSSY